jgi:hypothetical protein
MVWFPILGENRLSQLNVVMDAAAVMPGNAEICPIILILRVVCVVQNAC